MIVFSLSFRKRRVAATFGRDKDIPVTHHSCLHLAGYQPIQKARRYSLKFLVVSEQEDN